MSYFRFMDSAFPNFIFTAHLGFRNFALRKICVLIKKGFFSIGYMDKVTGFHSVSFLFCNCFSLHGFYQHLIYDIDSLYLTIKIINDENLFWTWFNNLGPPFIETTSSLTDRGRRPVKSEIIETPLVYCFLFSLIMKIQVTSMLGTK